jgi:hypothetical protein
MADVEKDGLTRFAEAALTEGPDVDPPLHLTAFITFLLRDHVPAMVLEKAMYDALQRPVLLESYPELKRYAQSVAQTLLAGDLR